MDGPMMLPPVSLPMAKPTNPAAVAAPGPALDPDDPSSSSHGFIVWPPNQMSFSASAPMLSLATSTAPASCRRFTTAASWVGTPPEWLSAVHGWDARGIHEVLGAPRDAMQWPTVLARPDFLVSLPGLRERELARERDYATQFRIEARKPLQVEIRKPLRRQFSLLDPAREFARSARRQCLRRLQEVVRDHSWSG